MNYNLDPFDVTLLKYQSSYVMVYATSNVQPKFFKFVVCNSC